VSATTPARKPDVGRRLSPQRLVTTLLRRVGLKVTRVGPGAALVSRHRVRVKEIDKKSVVISRRKGVRVRPLAPGATLVTEPNVLRDNRIDMEKEVHKFLLPEHLMQVFSMYGVNVVFDVGANRGQYGKLLRKAGDEGHIVSFEPVPEVAKLCEEVAADDEKWTVHAIAIGRENGMTTMNVVPGTLSSVLPPTDFGATRYDKLTRAETYDVPVRRLGDMLDEILARVPQPRPYLKLDTQGFDLEAFAGLGERTGDFVAMQSEIAFMQIYDGMPRYDEALAAYEGAGFEVTALYPVSRERHTGRVLEFDCVMVRPAATQVMVRPSATQVGMG